MRKQGKMTALLLTAVLLFSLLLTACGAKKVDGTYKGSYDMMDELNAELAGAGLELQGDLKADFILVLKEDKTFTMDIDAESFSERLITVFQDQGENMVRSMLDAEGITEDQYQWIAESAGYEDFSGLVDGLVDEMLSGMGDEMIEQLENEVSYTGTYDVSKDKIVLESQQGEETIVDEGTINSDGSIFISSRQDTRTLNITFYKQ